MTDIVEKLRKIAKYYRMSLQLTNDAMVMEEAVAEIERLRRPSPADLGVREALQALLDFPGGMYAPALEAKARAALAASRTEMAVPNTLTIKRKTDEDNG